MGVKRTHNMTCQYKMAKPDFTALSDTVLASQHFFMDFN